MNKSDNAEKDELRLFFRNHKDYLEHLAHSEENAFDGRPHYNPATGDIFEITRNMARYILMEFERKCTMCHKTKSEEQFRVETNSRTKKKKLMARCKVCESTVGKNYYRDNAQEIKTRRVIHNTNCRE